MTTPDAPLDVDGDPDYDGEPDIHDGDELPATADPSKVPADAGDGGHP